MPKESEYIYIYRERESDREGELNKKEKINIIEITKLKIV